MKAITRSATEILKNTAMFSEVEDKTIESLLSFGGYSLKNIKSGEELNVKNALIIVLSGEFEAYKNDGGKRAFLKMITPENITGIATLFDTSGQYISTLLAKKDSDVLILTEEFVLNAIRKSPSFAESFSRLICDKLRYLNSRIDTYTRSGAENKLLEFIKSSAKQCNGNPYIEMSMSSLSSALSVGRASLYRVINTLEESGRIKKDGKKIYFLK